MSSLEMKNELALSWFLSRITYLYEFMEKKNVDFPKDVNFFANSIRFDWYIKHGIFTYELFITGESSFYKDLKGDIDRVELSRGEQIEPYLLSIKHYRKKVGK